MTWHNWKEKNFKAQITNTSCNNPSKLLVALLVTETNRSCVLETFKI